MQSLCRGRLRRVMQPWCEPRDESARPALSIACECCYRGLVVARPSTFSRRVRDRDVDALARSSSWDDSLRAGCQEWAARVAEIEHAVETHPVAPGTLSGVTVTGPE